MSTPDPWDEPLPKDILPSPAHPLSNEDIDVLWDLFQAIVEHWGFAEEDIRIGLFRSRWLDMLEARSTGAPDYRGEYLNAVNVYKELVAAQGAPAAIAKIYQETLVTAVDQATTRLRHAKFYVVNDFIRCFVASGGFRGFVPKARNYAGFMGGSRFREWPPVRTGEVK